MTNDSENMDAKGVAHESLYGDGQPGDVYMNVTKYMTDASRTLSGGDVHEELVTPSMLVDAINEAQISAKHLDKIKKALFYGKQDADLAFTRGLKGDEDFTNINTNLLHGILGLYTEAAELLELLLEHIISREPADEKDVLNESGDAFWYLHVILKEIGSDFDEATRLNIDKLKKRFPVKFTEDLAVNRDEAQENVVFE